MAFTDDTRKTMLDQHATTTRILNEIKFMIDDVLLPETPIAQRKDELNDVFKNVNNDSKCVMSWIVFLFRIKRGGASGPPSQEKYDDICKKIGVSIDNHPQEFLQMMGEFGRAMNELGKQNAVKKLQRERSSALPKINSDVLVCNKCGQRSLGMKPGDKCNAPGGTKCNGRLVR